MVDVIIFDLWYTLAKKNISISGTLKRHFNIRASKDFVKRYERSIQLNKWRTPEHMARSFLKHFHLPLTKENIAFVVDVHKRSIRRPQLFRGMRRILQELAKQHTLVLLSNTSIFDKDVPERLGIDPYFDHIIFSWQINSLKPSKKDFDIVTRRVQAAPQTCLLIDDEPCNVRAARAYGMQGIRFKDVPSLLGQLKKKKLL